MSKGARRIRIFSALEVANICGVVNQTAINWIRSGHLKAFTTPGGQYRIYAKDLAAFLDKRGMSTSGEVLQVMMANANWNIFLLAADPSLNHSLKAELSGVFPEYTIIQAFDWFDTGRKAIEEKPGFMLLDAELPGADISSVVRTVKEDTVFGKPFVFLMSSGQRAEAVQADAVFTKPPDHSKLKAAIRAIEKQLEAVTA
jgi:excisionase family DNA binding protein